MHQFRRMSPCYSPFPRLSNSKDAFWIIRDAMQWITTTTTVLQPFFLDHPGEPMPEENFWTLWCKGRLTEAELVSWSLTSLFSINMAISVSDTPANFDGFRVLAALLHGSQVVRVSQTLRRWTEGATYVRQGDHHVGHWPTFLVCD